MMATTKEELEIENRELREDVEVLEEQLRAI